MSYTRRGFLRLLAGVFSGVATLGGCGPVADATGAALDPTLGSAVRGGEYAQFVLNRDSYGIKRYIRAIQSGQGYARFSNVFNQDRAMALNPVSILQVPKGIWMYKPESGNRVDLILVHPNYAYTAAQSGYQILPDEAYRRNLTLQKDAFFNNIRQTGRVSHRMPPLTP